MKYIVKIISVLQLLLLLFFAACFGSESSVDEDYHPGVPVKSVASLHIETSQSRQAIDLGESYSFGRQIVYSTSEISFTVRNRGERKASQISASDLTEPFSYKGGSYPGTGGTCSDVLEGESSCTIIVKYAPVSVDTHSNTLSLTYNNGRVSNATQVVSKPLEGEGYSLSPVISSLSTTRGPSSGGSSLTINGTYLRTGVTVYLGENACTHVTVSSSHDSLVCTVPAHAVGTVSLTLTNEFGQSSTLADTFTFIAAPTLTSISSSGGALAGGGTITLTGTNLILGSTIAVGNSTCSSVNVLSTTSLTCVLPSKTAGTYDVVLTDPLGQTASLSSAYTYRAAPTVSSISPSTGSILGGTTVTISGSGFVSGATVTVGGSTCTSPSVSSATSLSCVTPTGSIGAVDVVVTNSDGQSGTGTGAFSFIDLGGTWTTMSTTSAAGIRAIHTAVWTGSKMIVFGGINPTQVNTGGLYDPVTDTWTATSTTGAPTARDYHNAFWTGSKMVVWGGSDSISTRLNTGGLYDPATDLWTTMTTSGAPAGRWWQSAVWTGSKMLVFGGSTGGSPSNTNTGGVYDPQSDVWSSMTTNGAPSIRYQHSAVWTGSKLIIFGGRDSSDLNTGGVYDLLTDTWSATATTTAPGLRYGHSAVWTGSQMLIFGGWHNAAVNTGASYNPQTDTWSSISTTNVPGTRFEHTAVWTGGKMVVFGGRYHSGSFVTVNTGGIYDPFTDTWTQTTSTNAPQSRYYHTAVWTGGKMLVFGGYHWPTSSNINTGGVYALPTDSASNSWTTISTTNAPSTRYSQSAVWTGSKMLIWGGYSSGYVSTGGSYDPVTDSWTATSMVLAPTGRNLHTAVWTGSKMIVWGGYDGATGLYTGGQYDSVTDTWSATTTTSAPSQRYNHSVIWTGSKMIVFSGWANNSGYNYSNDGAQYDPVADTWSAMNTTSSPVIRGYHTAIWTGSKMLIWGGYNGTFLNTGGQYDPVANSWTSITTTGAPLSRYMHVMVWSGSKMLVYGGTNTLIPANYNTGGQYDPVANSWTSMTTSGAPLAARGPIAVWSGAKMLVWGGYNAQLSTYYNTGGQYDPTTDSWTTLSTTSAPNSRYMHTSVWTGSKLIIFGGSTSTVYNTGGVYTP